MTDGLTAAIDAIYSAGVDSDFFELARASEMLRGYYWRWHDEPLEVLAVEQQFLAPLINPETSAPSRTYQLGGKLDAVVRDLRDGLVYKVEHKTASVQIGVGSTYWKRLQIDPQISTYYAGARELGYDVSGCLYDVLAKPKQRPYKATPVEDRKYVQKTGALYANQREADETPDEYAARIRAAITADPDAYYQRGTVVRLESEERDAEQDRWQTARLIRESHLSGRFPRNPESCIRYERECDYFGVCTGTADLGDELLFRRTTNVHEELNLVEAAKVSLPIITNSEMKAFRRCNREHHYAYGLGYRTTHEAEALRFGSLVHIGLEAMWRANVVTRKSYAAV